MVPLFGKQFVSIKGIQALITGTEYLDTAYWTPSSAARGAGVEQGWAKAIFKEQRRKSQPLSLGSLLTDEKQ